MMVSKLAAFALGTVLWGLWVLLWREPDWPVIIAGLVFPAGMYLALRYGRISLRVPKSFFRLDLWFLFGVLVLWRVLLSVCRVGWSILAGGISPGVVVIPLELRTETAQLLFLWAITVTPGTIALLAEGNRLHVHCLYTPPGGELPELMPLQGLLQKLLG